MTTEMVEGNKNKHKENRLGETCLELSSSNHRNASEREEFDQLSHLLTTPFSDAIYIKARINEVEL
jgi:hypothetical protein